MPATKRITERVTAPFAGARVNRETGTITGVLICGTASANGRDYPAHVFRRDYARYEGRPVNCDHGRESTVDRRFGWFTGVRPGPDGRPRGTLNCLKSHPMYARVMEAAERNPALFGFSHVALCDTRPGPGGREVVEAIRDVESIDLVAQPATTKGLFEGTAVPLTRTRSSPLSRTAQRLAEIVGTNDPDDPAGANMPPTDAPIADGPPDDGASSDTALDDAFIADVVNEMEACMAARSDKDEFARGLGRLKKLLISHPEITGDPDDDDDGDDPDATDTYDPADADARAPEGRRTRAGAILEALGACDRIGFRATRADLELIAAAPANRRGALAERLMRADHERPTSAGRGRITVAGTGHTGRPPTDPKTFAEWLQ